MSYLSFNTLILFTSTRPLILLTGTIFTLLICKWKYEGTTLETFIYMDR